MHIPPMKTPSKKIKYTGTKPIFACICKESTKKCKATYHECTCHISTRNCKENDEGHECICSLSAAACKSLKHDI